MIPSNSLPRNGRVRQSGRSEMEGEHDIARRTVLMSAGVGIGAGLVS